MMCQVGLAGGLDAGRRQLRDGVERGVDGVEERVRARQGGLGTSCEAGRRGRHLCCARWMLEWLLEGVLEGAPESIKIASD